MRVIHVPDAMVCRLRGVAADWVAEEGMLIRVESSQGLIEIFGLTGDPRDGVRFRVANPATTTPTSVQLTTLLTVQQ